ILPQLLCSTLFPYTTLFRSKAMQRHGNHANVTTTLNDYMEEKSLDDLIIVDTNHHVPVEKFDELSKDELLKLIKNADRNIQVKLDRKSTRLNSSHVKISYAV